MLKGKSDLIIEHEYMETGMVRTDGVTGKRGEIEGVEVSEECPEGEEIKITRVKICSKQGSECMGRPLGNYITLEIPGLREETEELKTKTVEVLTEELLRLLGAAEHLLIIGLGNREVTVDRIGPETVDRICVTRHLKKAGAGESTVFSRFRSVSALVPGVMAQTGMETLEIIRGIVKEIKPDVVLAVDSLSARSVHRLNTTIQLTDTGISPGAGVGNHRSAINGESIGIPVLALGVPTVLGALSIAGEELKAEGEEALEGLLVMSRSIDSAVGYLSDILADGINAVNGGRGFA